MTLVDRIAEIRGDALDACERRALVERYTDGDCLVLAFAVHWLTGGRFGVEAVGERGRRSFAHFAAVDPDGGVWDAEGPRSRTACGARFAERPRWQRVDPHRFIATQPGIDEAAITEGIVAAIRLLGPRLDPHVARLPEGLPAPAGPVPG